MKVAQYPNTQQPVTASPSAPDKAICPHCGGVVVPSALLRTGLRQRRRMNDGGCAYFWRHQDNRNRALRLRSAQACNGRSHGIQL
ncbi:MAG TPA: hypothetical protein PLD25_32340 [Chloroflexota bacterium]|nr:hypothetical protein [Chloroflexota bacterium]HUM69083.1 hypothetical protein [Chloroflexota bacterium]